MKTSPNSHFDIQGLSAHHFTDWDGDTTRWFFHQHNEVELNFLSRGRAVYNMGGRDIALPLRSLCVFWGGVSHRIMDWKHDNDIWVFHIPLGIFLSWGLPRETFVQPLMRGAFYHEPDPAHAIHDEAAVRRWNACFRRICGVSLMRCVNQQRVAHAQCLLTNSGAKIIDVAMESGFGSVSQFYTVFRGITGVPPREYAKKKT